MRKKKFKRTEAGMIEMRLLASICYCSNNSWTGPYSEKTGKPVLFKISAWQILSRWERNANNFQHIFVFSNMVMFIKNCDKTNVYARWLSFQDPVYTVRHYFTKSSFVSSTYWLLICPIIKIKTDAITFADAFLLVPQNIFNNICEGVLKIFWGTM